MNTWIPRMFGKSFILLLLAGLPLCGCSSKVSDTHARPNAITSLPEAVSQQSAQARRARTPSIIDAQQPNIHAGKGKINANHHLHWEDLLTLPPREEEEMDEARDILQDVASSPYPATSGADIVEQIYRDIYGPRFSKDRIPEHHRGGRSPLRR